MTLQNKVADPSEICVAILAAGNSTRFGAEDKLTALLNGKMLGLHMSDRLAGIKFAQKVVIASASHHPCLDGWSASGFQTLVNAAASSGMGTSVALAAKFAADSDAKGLLICLADMPLIPVRHFQKLLTSFDGDDPDAHVASTDGKRNLPPAIFAKNMLPDLMRLDGDMGARHLLANAVKVELAEHLLIDIDDPETLTRLNAG